MVVSDGRPSVKQAATITAGTAGVPCGTVNDVLHDPPLDTAACWASGSVVDETDT
jgi:hypothetical protein